MSLFSDIINKLKKKRKFVSVNYDSKDLTENEKLDEAKAEGVYYKVKLAKILSEQKKQKESVSDKEKEQDKIKFLIEQEQELKKKDYIPFSIFKMVKWIDKLRKDKKSKIMFTTFDGKKEIGPVDDLIINPDGNFGAVSKGQVIWSSTTLKNMFYWVAGLGNHAKRKIIPLCVDEHGKFTPNIMQEEIPQYVKMSDGKFRINRTNTKEVSGYVAELNEDINEMNGEIEGLEETISEQQKEIKEKEREAKLHKNRADKIESELSIALQKVGEINKSHGLIVRQNTVLSNLKEINEDLVESYEKVFLKLSAKIEDELGSTIRDKEWEDLRHKIQFAKDNLGNITQIIQPKDEKPSITEGIRPVKP